MYVCGKPAYRDTHAYVSSWETYIPQTGSPAKHTDLAFYLMLCLRGTLIPVLLRSVRSDNTYIHTYIHASSFQCIFPQTSIHTIHTSYFLGMYVSPPDIHTYWVCTTLLCIRETNIPVLLRYVRLDHAYIHTYLFFSRYVCFPKHTYIPYIPLIF